MEPPERYDPCQCPTNQPRMVEYDFEYDIPAGYVYTLPSSSATKLGRQWCLVGSEIRRDHFPRSLPCRPGRSDGRNSQKTSTNNRRKLIPAAHRHTEPQRLSYGCQKKKRIFKYYTSGQPFRHRRKLIDLLPQTLLPGHHYVYVLRRQPKTGKRRWGQCGRKLGHRFSAVCLILFPSLFFPAFFVNPRPFCEVPICHVFWSFVPRTFTLILRFSLACCFQFPISWSFCLRYPLMLPSVLLFVFLLFGACFLQSFIAF